MSVNIRYPNITGGTEREQLSQVKSYLHQLVEQLNYALPTIGTGDGSTQSESSGTHDVQGGELSYYELKSLIVHELQQIDAEVAKAVDEALEKAIENGEFNGVSPTVSVTEIDGGHRVTITDKDGAKTFDVMDGKDGTGGGGTSEAIIDVVELPTENINEDVFYRVVIGSVVINQYTDNASTIHCVQNLPETGLPATNADQTEINVYFSVSDKEAYGYVDDLLSMWFGVPVGWYPIAMLYSAFGYEYAGVITAIKEDPIDGAIRILLEYVICSYKNGIWTLHKTVGRIGSGNSAEEFNHPTNIASGICSHAEGIRTTASGDTSHAEGNSTTASGSYSHAEGLNTTSSGEMSHAEGNGTQAIGECSHAEGEITTARGECSHAEGAGTRALGDSQHVQGRFNIDDADGKYAHIVGNGRDNSDLASNAHTLDWNGLGWFAGGLKVGGTGQDDPNAEEILTKSQVQALIASGGLASDHIVEQGTSGIWTYRKWNSGIAECWGMRSIDTKMNTAWGTMYTGTATPFINYPFTFASVPVEQVTLHSGRYACWLFGEASDAGGRNTTTRTGAYNVARPTATTEVKTLYFDYYVIGRWK